MGVVSSLEKFCIIYKWIGPLRNLFFKLFIFFLYVFLVSYLYLQGVIQIVVGIDFDLYRGDRTVYLWVCVVVIRR